MRARVGVRCSARLCVRLTVLLPRMGKMGLLPSRSCGVTVVVVLCPSGTRCTLPGRVVPTGLCRLGHIQLLTALLYLVPLLLMDPDQLLAMGLGLHRGDFS